MQSNKQVLRLPTNSNSLVVRSSSPNQKKSVRSLQPKPGFGLGQLLHRPKKLEKALLMRNAEFCSQAFYAAHKRLWPEKI